VIDPATSIGAVHLTVGDLAEMRDFYADRLGMRVRDQESERVSLGTPDRSLLVLQERKGATRVPGTTGLYHFAVLVPSRLELARSLRQLVATGTPLQGASDHGVSEALYLSDPEGNGIEIYRDRPREQWPRTGNGLNMTVDPLDLDGLIAEIDASGAHGATPHQLDARTVMGHVHLHVSRLPEAESFYADVLGFEVTQRYGRGALFVSAGGYHHHLGLNTWAGVGNPPAPAGSLGLDYFVVQLPNDAARARVLDRLAEARVPLSPRPEGVLVADPGGNSILLAA
jgi:catechol 2,3-dioxygenase